MSAVPLWGEQYIISHGVSRTKESCLAPSSEQDDHCSLRFGAIFYTKVLHMQFHLCSILRQAIYTSKCFMCWFLVICPNLECTTVLNSLKIASVMLFFSVHSKNIILLNVHWLRVTQVRALCSTSTICHQHAAVMAAIKPTKREPPSPVLFHSVNNCSIMYYSILRGESRL